MKIGDALIRAGLINRTQLSQALERQVIMGERLGASLMELGYVSESDLVNCLSNLSKVPPAPFSAFLNLPAEVIQLVSKDLAVKYQVIPLKKERNQIHLAMADPTDFKTIEEIRFILGSAVVPYVASDLRVQLALEKYYGVKREQRYVSLTTLLEDKPSFAPSPPPPPPPDIAPPLPDIAPPLSPPPAVPVVPSMPVPVAPMEKALEILPPLEAASRDLANITGREDLGRILLRFAQSKLKRVVLFVIKGDKAFGWMGGGSQLIEDVAPQIEVNLNLPSVLSDAVNRKNPQQGALLPLPENQKLLAQLGEDNPQEVLALPVTIKGKAVMALYGDNGDRNPLKEDYEDLIKLTFKASMALEILILRNKILEMG